MTQVKAALEASNGKRMPIEFEIGEQVIIGYDSDAGTEGAEKPDYDLGELLPADELKEVAARHAALTYEEGDFRIKTLQEHPVSISLYEVTPGHLLRVVDGDTVRFGDAELTFHIQKVGQDPSAVTEASVEEQARDLAS